MVTLNLANFLGQCLFLSYVVLKKLIFYIFYPFFVVKSIFHFFLFFDLTKFEIFDKSSGKKSIFFDFRNRPKMGRAFFSAPTETTTSRKPFFRGCQSGLSKDALSDVFRCIFSLLLFTLRH